MKQRLLQVAVVGALVTTSAATSAVVLPAVLDGPVTANMVIEEFADYEPPDRLQITRQDYLTSTGSPSDKPTDWPTWQNDMQHRAYFYGAGKVQGGSTYFQEIYVVMSKEPISNYFEFTYRADKDRQYGYIRADFSAGLDVMRYDKEWAMLAGSHISFAEGKNPPSVGIASLPHFADFPGNRNRSYFDFDFYYQCCGDLEIEGLRNITEVPYPYILTCTDENGHGGGSQSGSSSSGSSGGGSSSGGDGSGGSSGGGSSGGGSESSKEEWETDGEYPWQSSDNEREWSSSTPPYTDKGEGDSGERETPGSCRSGSCLPARRLQTVMPTFPSSLGICRRDILISPAGISHKVYRTFLEEIFPKASPTFPAEISPRGSLIYLETIWWKGIQSFQVVKICSRVTQNRMFRRDGRGLQTFQAFRKE